MIMRFLPSIRAKTWLCVGVALFAYLVTTGLATYSNYRTSSALTAIEEVHTPLVFKANTLASLLQDQRLKFEEGILTADSHEVVEANLDNDQIDQIFGEMLALANNSVPEIYPVLLSLRDNYDEYFSLAEIYYLNVAEGEDIFRLQREIYQLGIMRMNLENLLQDFILRLQRSVTDKIKDEKQRAFANSRILLVFFIVIFIVIFQLINRLSSRLLIEPLAQLEKMIRDFGRGRPVQQPQKSGYSDEIEALSTTFWNMAEEHKELTVSRDYVDKILATMSDALVVLTPDIIVQRVNQSALELIQVQFNEAVGYPFSVFLGRAFRNGKAKNLFQEILSGKKVTNYEMSVWSKDRGEIDVLFSGRAFYSLDGNVEGIVCLIKDISEFTES